MQEKRFENSREIFTKILENRESKKVENSRNFSLEKSRERNPSEDKCIQFTVEILKIQGVCFYNTFCFI